MMVKLPHACYQIVQLFENNFMAVIIAIIFIKSFILVLQEIIEFLIKGIKISFFFLVKFHRCGEEDELVVLTKH